MFAAAGIKIFQPQKYVPYVIGSVVRTVMALLAYDLARNLYEQDLRIPTKNAATCRLVYHNPQLLCTSFIPSTTMVVRIRLSMHGTTNNKYFHLVAINNKQARNAKPIEKLGVFRPAVDRADGSKAKTVEWSVHRIKYWLGVGAIPSQSAVRLLTQVCCP